ncbi:S8 family serine peptidase [Plebeiibacterium sediminum]|uniref:S8 family serine peptidase n=1 Tax=Plebeiibacterium sediminum TaxID=2992112 RepID=A0AAE3M5S7_9BACT|nr:S8 family serine peptidase [Plebeiobacterium sediminum]MCW3787694.1 S8 family serine peptidase [Plebeiobacterium sediminum]
MKRLGFIICILSGIFFNASGQYIQNKQLLHEFMINQKEAFDKEYYAARKYFEQYHILKDTLINPGHPKRLIFFMDGIPVYFQSHNQQESYISGIISFYNDSYWHDGLSGEHQLIGIWDAGHVFYNHNEFNSDNFVRVIIEEPENPFDHATHVGGTIIASGFNAEARGMANAARLYSADYMNDIYEVAYASDKFDINLSNHSYGLVSGWNYNSDEEIWYWYGNTGVDTAEDYKFGFYGSTTASIDELCSLLPDYTMVVSAGNDLHEGPEEQPVTHKVWLGKWKNSNEVRDIDGGDEGYDCIGINGVAKNVITVGCVDYEQDPINITSFSSCGPTDDGRIKPDIVAPGVGVFSSIAANENAYAYYSGTSMSAAVVSGGVALLNEMQYQFQSGINCWASSIKGLLIHSAKNISGNIGPNYKSGWGMVDFESAHQLLEDNILSAGKVITEASILKNDSYSKSITVSQSKELKVTLVWTDLAGEANDAELNNTTSKLINDLDLYIVKGEEKYYPFVLNPTAPSQPASTGVNVLDNVEQVIIENCEAGEYTVFVDASKITTATQNFSLIISGHDYDVGFVPASNLNGFYDSSGFKIYWNAPKSVVPDGYEISINSGEAISVTDTFYTDNSYELYEDLTYTVKAVYGQEEKFESLVSNPISMKALPLYQVSYQEHFEIENNDWQCLNTELGWRFGDCITLGSTYVDFSENQSLFMGINSDNLGSGVHVTDLLISPPIALENNSVIDLDFQYYMNNSVYNTNDVLSLYYRTSINQDWVLLKDLESVESWTSVSESFELVENEGIIQLAFLFDDNNEWGNGAAIDDFYIKESIPDYLDFQSTIFTSYYANGIMYYKDLSIESEFAEWYIIDCGGEIVNAGKTYINSGITSFKVMNLNKGVYFVVLQTSKGRVIKKILKLE